MQIPPFNSYLGTDVRRVAAGEANVVLELAPQHLNNRGVAHGGVIASLLDSAMGAAVIFAIPPEWWCATTSLSVQFLEGARKGRLTAEGRVLRRGGRVAFAGGEVRDESGKLVATAQGSWYLWSRNPDETAVEPFVTLRGTTEKVRVGKIVGVGRNYPAHIREMGGAGPDAGLEPPVLFLKPPSALVQGRGVVRLPEGHGAVHHEVEMVVVIGRGGRCIREDRALEHVLGYAVGLDMTLRDVQSAAKAKGEPWALAKGFDTSAPISPVAPREEVGDGSGLALALRVNGRTRQAASTSEMIRGVAALVACASSLMTLARGDLIFTGTPAGVGPVAAGDLLEATLERVGDLAVRVEAEEEQV